VILIITTRHSRTLHPGPLPIKLTPHIIIPSIHPRTHTPKSQQTRCSHHHHYHHHHHLDSPYYYYHYYHIIPFLRAYPHNFVRTRLFATMGNNPSRASAQPQQQQHHHQHHHFDQQHSTPTSPPIANVPARAASTSSSRTIINRRNSLQPAPSKHTSASASVPPEDPLTLPIRSRNEPASPVEARYIPQGRRESIAEAISSVPWTIDRTTQRPTPGFGDDDPLTSPTVRKLQTADSTPTAVGEDLPSLAGTPLSAGPHADPLTKRGSMGSTTTVDEEVDVADTRTIPTLIQWLQGGHKVYVTGTFSNWRKRFKLNRRFVPPLSPPGRPPSLMLR